MDSKHAFKMGFVLKLAQEQLSVHDLFVLAKQRLKQAAEDGEDEAPKKKKPKDDSAELPGSGLDSFSDSTVGVGNRALNAAAPMARTVMTGGLAAGVTLPYFLGNVGGDLVQKGLTTDLDSVEDMRKRYLIKRYRDLIAQQKIRRQNNLVSMALRP